MTPVLITCLVLFCLSCIEADRRGKRPLENRERVECC